MEAIDGMTTIETRLQDAIARMHEPWGGAHCLDFANTLEPRGGPPPIVPPPGYEFRDELTTYDDLAAWAVHKGTLDPPAAVALLATADADPSAAAQALARALALRDAIYRVFWQIADNHSPADDDLAVITREYADAAAHATITVLPTCLTWSWPDDGHALARPLWPVAQSALDLLTNGDRQRIRVCPGPGRPPFPCGWLFYDTSRNATRRWCSMADCGSTTKARLQTARRRAQRTKTQPH